MKMDIIAGSKDDEFYTPEYAIKPLLKYIKPSSKILCPFDTEQSKFVEVLRNEGHEVLNTHIEMGKDFFKLKKANVDYIISNPPYSVKTEVIEKLFELNVPFAMLVGVIGLFESKKRFEMFRSNKFEIMYLNKRISYFKNYEEQKPSLNPPFSSVYICHNVLPKQIVFEEINK